MCRWMAWFGQPVLIDEVLFKTQHGIVDQSLHARMGAEPTNGDGFGLGWYGSGEGPAVYHSVAPAWGDANLRELAAHIESPLFLAHVRAAIGSPVQQTNCHPFRHGQWLFVHNGYIADFACAQARPDARDRPRAVRGGPRLDGHRGRLLPRPHVRARGGPDRGTRADRRPHRGDRGAATGWTIRCRAASASRTARACGPCATRPMGRPRSLFASADVDSIRRLHPDNARVRRLSHDDRVIVSEPFADLPGDWHEIPPATRGDRAPWRGCWSTSRSSRSRPCAASWHPFPVRDRPDAHVVSAQATAAGSAGATSVSASEVVGSPPREPQRQQRRERDGAERQPQRVELRVAVVGGDGAGPGPG